MKEAKLKHCDLHKAGARSSFLSIRIPSDNGWLGKLFAHKKLRPFQCIFCLECLVHGKVLMFMLKTTIQPSFMTVQDCLSLEFKKTFLQVKKNRKSRI